MMKPVGGRRQVSIRLRVAAVVAVVLVVGVYAYMFNAILRENATQDEDVLGEASSKPAPARASAAPTHDSTEALLELHGRRIKAFMAAQHNVTRDPSRDPSWLVDDPTCTGEPDGQGAEACELLRELWDKVDSQQRMPGPCPAEPSAVVGCDTAWATGLGHHFHHVGFCLTHALMRSQPVHMLPCEWSYGRGCSESPQWLCFFRSFAGECHAVRGMPEPVPRGWLAQHRTRDGHHPAGFASWGPSAEAASWHPWPPSASCPHVDPPLLLKAALLRWAFRPTLLVGRFFAAHWAAMGVRRPYAAMHIRRGDKVGLEAAFHPLDEYLEGLRAVMGPHEPLRDVFVASDDPEALVEGRRRYPQIQWHALEGAATLGAQGVFRQQGAGTQLLLGDIAWLASADYFCGTFSSQISRLVFELVVSRRPASTYCYRELAAPEPQQPIVAQADHPEKHGPFRLPSAKHSDLPLRAASLDSGYYYGSR